MQATAIGTVAVTIVLLGAFLFARASLAHFGNDLMNHITISVYVKPDATQTQEDTLRTAFAKDLRIASTDYVPKRDGLKELEQRMRGQVDVSSFLTENPLPDKFRVRVRTPEEVPAVAASIKKLPGVQSVDYGQDVVARLLQLGAVARRAGIGLIAVFVLVAGIIISNTIRLTVFARRREISIMQLVGATNMYIRLPFICEGLIDGTLGTALAIGLLVLARITLMPKLALALPWLQLNAAQVDSSSLVLQLFAVGAAVGVVASWIAVGRYLRT
ncbi:MAG TPA: permease-like cell division protein FtsX [Candidatus Baltobacteraceae bacterium]|nr:permease-like cell division protein FtsX [Candidatus Baltobacteraceae bacterium]